MKYKEVRQGLYTNCCWIEGKLIKDLNYVSKAAIITNARNDAKTRARKVQVSQNTGRQRKSHS